MSYTAVYFFRKMRAFFTSLREFHLRISRMLNEDEVVDAVCAYLTKKRRYKIMQRCGTTQRGIDIIAKHPKRGKLYVEAKGGTSARHGSPRYGRAYDSNQVFDRVAKGFYTAAGYRAYGKKSGLAFPDTPLFQKHLDPVRPLLKRLGIALFLVGNNRRVKIW